MYNSGEDELIERVAAALRHPERLSADFDDRVMAAIQSRPRTSLFSGLADWLLSPRSIQMSPAGALAVVLLISAAALVTWEVVRRDDAAPQPAQVAHHDGDAVQVVQFVFVAPQAGRVALVGDFNGWDRRATPMERGAPAGVWTVAIPLEVGRHHYAFVVDDEQWAADPAAPPAVSDDFGTPSSVVTVATGSEV